MTDGRRPMARVDPRGSVSAIAHRPRTFSTTSGMRGGTAVETHLHRQLKERFGLEAGGRSEVVVGGYRVDAVAPDGQLVEVQSGALGPLRAKLTRLLREHRVRVVKPVVVARRIVRRAVPDGPDLSA